jgi:hypothetical protein
MMTVNEKILVSSSALVNARGRRFKIIFHWDGLAEFVPVCRI